jgi:hypothetical protein
MKNSDEAVERVLAGLRETEAPAGMERRILESVRDIVPKRSWWRPMMPLLLTERRRWAVVVAGVIVVSSMACWTVLREQRPGRESTRSKRQVAPGSSTSPEVQVAAAGVQQPLVEGPVVRRKGKTNELRVRGVREDGSAVGLHERSMANHPAPEAPLTAEEKLLLRMAHRRDPVEMAALNPLLRAARDAEEKAEVQRFFEPPTTGENK